MNNISTINNLTTDYLKKDIPEFKLHEVNDFINKNLRMIIQQTENRDNIEETKELQNNLLQLSHKISKNFDNPLANNLAFEIMGMALGILSDVKKDLQELPFEVLKILLDHLNKKN